ncbi:hypothetical protein G114_02924 [Aeromonas diversa CDC 2478-85]|uniref:Uncharacterized protein n=2 Tax=Aeromonas diversa TaxID=502790 RepID=N9VPG7_9GAMM|nr:hypothetical protein [Aeromonas diversa]ENY73468.1 hypothetical protein G114_02924 [Aeromonas diversa CDC 2478-85]
MACVIEINPATKTVTVNRDAYDLTRVSGVQTRRLTWRDKLLNMLLLGLLTSSILFLFVPPESQGQALTLLLPGLGFVTGVVMGMFASASYAFMLEFRFGDETGVQWVTVAKSRHAREFALFKAKEQELRQALHR